MVTRFDNNDKWCGTSLSVVPLKDLIVLTDSLLKEPESVRKMLLVDIESNEFTATVSEYEKELYKKQSITNVTSLKASELTKYVMTTPLFKGLCTEMVLRGVNVENLFDVKNFNAETVSKSEVWEYSTT